MIASLPLAWDGCNYELVPSQIEGESSNLVLCCRPRQCRAGDGPHESGKFTGSGSDDGFFVLASGYKFFEPPA